MYHADEFKAAGGLVNCRSCGRIVGIIGIALQQHLPEVSDCGSHLCGEAELVLPHCLLHSQARWGFGLVTWYWAAMLCEWSSGLSKLPHGH